MNPIRSFLFGLTLPLRAARLIVSHRALLALSIVPVLVSMVLYFYLFSTMQESARLWVEHHFQGWSAWIMLVLARIALVIAGVFTFSIAASIVASPFNDILAEKAEPHANPPLERVESKGLAHQMKLVMIDVFKSVAAAAAGFGALLLSWVPGLNVVAFLVAFLLLAFQFVSYPQTRRGQGLGEGFVFLGRNFAACAGFGMGFTFLFAIPIVSAFCLPVAVVAGTLLYARVERPQLKAPSAP